MNTTNDLIHNIEWKNLIVLDACRFDAFRDNYKDFLDGNLVKARSLGSVTDEFLLKTFTDQYDCQVYSANPYINNKKYRIQDWYAVEHMQNRIHEVWRTYDKETRTTHPETLVDYAIKWKEDHGGWYHHNIFWFMQPHFPWVGKTRVGWANGMTRYQRLMSGEFPKEFLWKGYTENLRAVLAQVVRLVGELEDEGPVYITSDHGEVLGENGIDNKGNRVFGHFYGVDHPILREVPWMEITGVKE